VSGAHEPPEHVPLQHDALVEHGRLSAMHPPVVDVVVVTGVVVVVLATATGAQRSFVAATVTGWTPNWSVNVAVAGAFGHFVL
jgi:hypothetical protein